MTSQCYGIDGTLYARRDQYIPCNATSAATGRHTSCCAPGDNCLTNGFCQSQLDNKRKANIFWRNGCTDPTWKDPACPKHCEDNLDNHAVFYCLEKDSWCCPTGGDPDGSQIVNTTCCSTTNLVFTAADPLIYTVAEVNIVATATQSPRIAGTPTPALIDSISGIAGTNVQSTQISSPSSSPSSPSSISSTSPSNDKIGVYVGVPLGIALAIAITLIAWLVVHNRKLRMKRETGDAYSNELLADPKQIEYAHSHVTELGTGPEELSTGDYLRAELGANDEDERVR